MLDQKPSLDAPQSIKSFAKSRLQGDLPPSDVPIVGIDPNYRETLNRSVGEGFASGIPTSPADLEAQDTLYDGLVKRPLTYPGPKTHLEAILLRYFVEELARKFDLCDPERHFTQVIPQRARSSAPLLKAILTTSCRHLIRLRRHRHQTGVVEWQGNMLDELDEDTAVYYHNECIRELLRLSMDPEQIHNETLLAAAIILRTDEEMQAPLSDEDGDQEIFLNMLNLFLEAQIPPVVALPHSSPQIYLPDSPWDNTTGESPSLEATASNHMSHASPLERHTKSTYLSPRVPPSPGLRQACFWVALRQEIFTSFMKQRALKFPLSRCGAFRSLSLAEDAVWADRLVICCADVLEYCYGSIESGSAPDRSARRWEELRLQEKELTKYLPSSFEPTYYKAANKETGEIFPKVWYSDDSNVTGTTHLELARILLAVFNPTRPRLGPRAVAGMKDLALQLRNIVLRICGIALSHPMLPSVFNEALMSIVTCGEYFEDHEEQEALLKVLDFVRDEHALPIGRVAAKLQEAWGWD